MKRTVPPSLVAATFAAAFLILIGPALSQVSGSANVKFNDIEMSAYTAPDKSFSVFYPKKWTPQPSQTGMTFVENTKDANSARIDLFVIPLGQESRSARQIVELLAGKMKELYPTFAITDTRQLSEKPDAVAVLFSYRDGQVPMSGFALAASLGNTAIWADIYGKDSGFSGYNPTSLLTYVLQSMNQGPTPTVPKVPVVSEKAKQAAAGADVKKKTAQAMTMTHYWNMYPYLYPGGVFRSGF